MVKRDLVTQIAKDTGHCQRDVTQIVQMFLDGVSDELVAGGTLEFRNFGIFEVVTRKARVGRNPRKADVEIKIPERKVIKFRAGKSLKDRIQNS